MKTIVQDVEIVCVIGEDTGCHQEDLAKGMGGEKEPKESVLSASVHDDDDDDDADTNTNQSSLLGL